MSLWNNDTDDDTHRKPDTGIVSRLNRLLRAVRPQTRTRNDDDSETPSTSEQCQFEEHYRSGDTLSFGDEKVVLVAEVTPSAVAFDTSAVDDRRGLPSQLRKAVANTTGIDYWDLDVNSLNDNLDAVVITADEDHLNNDASITGDADE